VMQVFSLSEDDVLYIGNRRLTILEVNDDEITFKFEDENDHEFADSNDSSDIYAPL